MPLTVTGTSHHVCPVSLRERLAFAPERLDAPLRQLRQRVADGGVVLVSTCNRVEAYTSCAAPAGRVHETVRDFLAQWHEMPATTFDRYIYALEGREAVAHLFRVAASLDSMVVGEAQILGQMQDAFLAAQAAGATDKVLNAAFQRAFKVAKKVRTESDIGAGRVSVASVAVGLAAQIFGELHDKTVLVVGSGDTGRATLTSLVANGARRVIVANRTLAAAAELAGEFHGEAIGLESMRERLHEADILISSTAADRPILASEDFSRALRTRSHDPMFVIDIAVPRDVHPEVKDLDNVYLYDMDDLQEVANQNIEARRAQLTACQAMVEEQVEKFVGWHRGLQAEPTILSMREELDAIRQRELEKTLGMLPDLDEKARAEVEYLTRRIVGNILQQPLRQIKVEVAEDDAGSVLGLVKRLFGITDREELL